MKQIAERAGVSRPLVSYALNGTGTISPTKRAEILQIAQELGYRPNSLARAIATGRNQVLGFIGHDEANAAEFQWRLLRGALEEAKLHGYLIKTLLTTDPELSAQFCLESRLAGLISVTASDPGFLELQRILREQKDALQTPLVLVENEEPVENAACVSTDYAAGIELVVRHLVELGHRRIAYISGGEKQFSAQNRRAHFVRIAQKWGVAPAPELLRDGLWWNRAHNVAVTRALLDLPQPPTAIVGAGDAIALCAIAVAQEKGWRVPQDLSVTGFADFQMAEFSSPALTTIAQPFEEIGALAVRCLLEYLESQDAFDAPTPAPPFRTQNTLQPLLVVRHSTAPPRV